VHLALRRRGWQPPHERLRPSPKGGPVDRHERCFLQKAVTRRNSIPYHTAFSCLEVARQSWSYFPASPSFCLVLRTGSTLENSHRKQHFKAAAARPKATAQTKGSCKPTLGRARSAPRSEEPWHRCPLRPHGPGAGPVTDPGPVRKPNIALFWSVPITAGHGAGREGGGHTTPPTRVAAAAPAGLEPAVPELPAPSPPPGCG